MNQQQHDKRDYYPLAVNLTRPEIDPERTLDLGNGYEAVVAIEPDGSTLLWLSPIEGDAGAEA